MSLSGHPQLPQSRWGWAQWLVGLQLLVTIAAGVGAVVQIESIVGFCPAMAATGGITFFVAWKRRQRRAAFYGLSAPAVTGVIALAIAIMRWSPSEGHVPCAVFLVVYAVVAMAYFPQASRSLRIAAPAGPPVRFRLRTIFIAMTCVAVLAAIVGRLAWVGEMGWFAAYGCTVLVLSLVGGLLCFGFESRPEDVGA